VDSCKWHITRFVVAEAAIVVVVVAAAAVVVVVVLVAEEVVVTVTFPSLSGQHNLCSEARHSAPLLMSWQDLWSI